MASIDVIFDGRLTVSVGTGGREHDYSAAGVAMVGIHQRQDDCVAELRRLWAGQSCFPGADPVGPSPAQPGGPPIFTSARGPKGIARATRWASGFTGASLSGDPADMAIEAQSFLDNWAAAGGSGRPYTMTSCFFALGDDARARMGRVTERYFTVGDTPPPPGLVDSMMSHVTDDGAVKAALDGADAAGFDEIVFIATTDDVGDLDRLATVVGGL